MENELKSVRYQSETYPKLTTLINRVNESALMAAHYEQSRNKASGVDKVTKDTYSEHLIDNVINVIKRMKSFKYVPQPVLRTYIPKANGKKRPLGIPAYEDKLVQKVMADILNEVYEPRFLDCSYGFRPDRRAHDVVKEINRCVMFKHVNFVLEADIKGFFDNIDQKWLMTFLAHDIADKNFLRYIARFLKAGIMEDGKFYESDKGTPQGGNLSPVLANVFLHYVLDLWVEKVLKKQMFGEVYYVRYADDFILMFQAEKEAKQALVKLEERLGRFGLELAKDKTRILPIGRYRGTKEKFDFLGFTFLNGKTRDGKYMLYVVSSEKKLKAKRQDLKKWLHSHMHQPVGVILSRINRSLQGHYNYYGVSGNYRKLRKFWDYVKVTTLKALRRRGQKHPITWARFLPLWDRFVRQPRIKVDIWYGRPNDGLEQPCAGNLHAGLCEGWAQ